MTRRRRRVAAVVAVLFLAAIGWAGWELFGRSRAPANAVPPSVEGWYPLEAGLRWTYFTPGGISVVRELGAPGEDGWQKMSFQLPLLGTRTLEMKRRGGEILGRLEGREQVILRFPMRPGDSWTIDFPAWPEVAICTVEGPEEIEFLGRRSAAQRLRVVRRHRTSGRERTDQEWYAEGFGLVRMSVTQGPARFEFGLDRLERR